MVEELLWGGCGVVACSLPTGQAVCVCVLVFRVVLAKFWIGSAVRQVFYEIGLVNSEHAQCGPRRHSRGQVCWPKRGDPAWQLIQVGCSHPAKGARRFKRSQPLTFQLPFQLSHSNCLGFGCKFVGSPALFFLEAGWISRSAEVNDIRDLNELLKLKDPICPDAARRQLSPHSCSSPPVAPVSSCLRMAVGHEVG